jgi:hypothetical protein
VVEDCQQQRSIVTLRMAFVFTATGVHDRPESLLTINWIECSRSNGIGVHDPPERAIISGLDAPSTRVTAFVPSKVYLPQ